MAFEATKRELGELYTFFRLLADGKVFPGTPDAQRDDRKCWPVALIQREEHDGTRRYYIGEEDVRIVSGTVEKDGTFTASAGKEPLSFPRADFGDAAEIILHLLRNEQGEEVEVSEGLEAFLDAVNIYDLESRTDDRTDFSVAHGLHRPLSSQPHESFAGRRAHGQSEAGAERREVCRAHGKQGERFARIAYGSCRTHDDD